MLNDSEAIISRSDSRRLNLSSKQVVNKARLPAGMIAQYQCEGQLNMR